MPVSPPQLDTVLARPEVWRGRQPRPARGLSSGLPALDRLLYDGGWPRGAITELCAEQTGLGELRLLLPSLAGGSQNGHSLLLIDPPYPPYAPAWQAAGIDLSAVLILRTGRELEQRWALEQALARPGTLALCWPKGQPRYAELRKLQLAASRGDTCGFLFRNPSSLNQTSPAALRLALLHTPQGLQLTVHKQRGGRAGQSLYLAAPDWLVRTPAESQARRGPSTILQQHWPSLRAVSELGL